LSEEEPRKLRVLDPDSGRVLIMTVKNGRILRIEYAECDFR